MTQHPELLWAQRSSETQEDKNILYITVNLPDIVKDSLEYDLTSTSISFKAKSKKDSEAEPKEYAFDLSFFAEVVPEKSKQKLGERCLNLVIRKKDAKLDYWPRLTKEKTRNAFVKTDFDKWVDEDEQDGTKDDVNEDDMSPFGGMGGMPGMGGGMPGMGGGMPGMGGGMPDFGGGMPGGMDFNKMMANLGSGSSSTDPAADEPDEDSDDDGPPPLEDAEASK